MKTSREFKIGVVILFAIGAFIWGFNFLKGSDIFTHKYELFAVYPKIEGLLEANPLQINGFKIGQVNKISLIKRHGEHQVLVKFLLTEDVQIPKGSIAKIVSSDLLGSKAVEIIFNDSVNVFVQSGDTLESATQDDLAKSVRAELKPLQEKTNQLLSSIDSVMVIVQYVLNDKTRDNLAKSFESIKKAINTLEQTAYKLDELVDSERSKISSILSKLNSLAGMLEKNTGRIDNVINNLSVLSDSLAKSQLKAAIDDADKTLKEMNTLIAKINAGEGTLGKLAKNEELYYNMVKSTEDMDKLLRDLRYNPERYIHFSVFGRKKTVYIDTTSSAPPPKPAAPTPTN